MRLLCIALASLSLMSCVAEVDDELEEATSELSLPVPPVVLLPSHNRMLWRDSTGLNGELWIVSDRGGINARTPISVANRELLGVAGNRVLWRNGRDAEMRSFDDNGVLGTTVLPIANPNPAWYVPRSIALATNACWSPTTQNYYILWDDTTHNEVAIQLVDQNGAQRRVDFVRKPFSSAPALWFGFAADGYEELMLRPEAGTGTLFRASWNSSPPSGWSVATPQKASKSRSSFTPTGAGRVVSSFTFWLGTFDAVLFTSSNSAVLELYQATANMPPLLNPVLPGSPAVTYSFTGPVGQFAYAFTGNPNTCN